MLYQHNKNFVYLLSIILLLNACKTPQTISWHNTESHWNSFSFSEKNEVSDTAFVMVSNRHFTPNELRFADNICDTSQQHILYVCKKNNHWYVKECATLKEALLKLPKRNWVLYTEGMGKIFTSNVERAYLMSSMYHVNVVLFDYASISDIKGIRKSYKFANNNSANSYLQYARFLNEIKKLKENSDIFSNVKLSIFLHSMGNAMFRQMMLEHAYDSIKGTQFVDNIIFNASCINRKNHHRWMREIDFAKNIYINYNRKDKQLNGASLLTGNRKLGSKPKYPYSTNASYIDFETAVEKEHSYFLNFPYRNFQLSPVIQKYFSQVLNGVQPQVTLFDKSKVVGFSIKK